jgi:hypothetical protein
MADERDLDQEKDAKKKDADAHDCVRDGENNHGRDRDE